MIQRFGAKFIPASVDYALGIWAETDAGNAEYREALALRDRLAENLDRTGTLRYPSTPGFRPLTRAPVFQYNNRPFSERLRLRCAIRKPSM